MLQWIMLGLSVLALSSSAACLWTACRLNETNAADREDLYGVSRSINGDLATLDRVKAEIAAEVALISAYEMKMKPTIAIHRPEANGSA